VTNVVIVTSAVVVKQS